MLARLAAAALCGAMWQPCGAFQPGQVAGIAGSGSGARCMASGGPAGRCAPFAAPSGRPVRSSGARLRARTGTETGDGDAGDAGADVSSAPAERVTVKTVIGQMGVLRLAVLGAALLWVLSRILSALMSPGMLLPQVLADNWAIQVSRDVPGADADLPARRLPGVSHRKLQQSSSARRKQSGECQAER